MHTFAPLQFGESGQLEINPSANSSKSDFDFLKGKWQVKNRKLSTRLNKCEEWMEFSAEGEMRIVLDGIGNIDNFQTILNDKPFEGMTLRLFNPATRLWSIYWADSHVGILDTPVVGSFDNDTGLFFTKDIFMGKDILVVFHWDIADVDHPVWSQAFSDDEGKTWEWNWYMYMSRPPLPTDGYPQE